MFYFIINIIIFIALLILIANVGKNKWSLALRTFFGLFLGVLFGVLLQYFYGFQSEILKQSIEWFNIVGNGYVLLLQMIVMPLVFASILSAVARLHSASSLGKIASLTIGTLLLTTAISALVGILVVLAFHLNAQGLITSGDLSDLATYEAKQSAVSNMTVPQMILSFIPKNPFAELTGARPTSIISVVIFASFLGSAAIMLLKSNKEKGEAVLSAIDTLQLWIMKLVRIVILLTPYGVFALMAKMSATSNSESIIKFATFLIASYVALAIMFCIHALLLSLTGINPFRFFKKVFPVLTFAFTSRSSAASIPLNIEAQVSRIGVPQSIASFSASFGTTIGQNGCAGIYPAMLATMIAPTVGINPFDPAWIMMLVAIVTLSSIGVAGVGGGATFAALIVLPTMGLPITLVPLLIAIEPLIDMGRTALNVNGSMTAGTITSQIMKQTDMTVFNSNDDADLKQV